MCPLLSYPADLNETKEGLRAAFSVVMKVTGMSNITSMSPLLKASRVPDPSEAEQRATDALKKAVDDLHQAGVLTADYPWPDARCVLCCTHCSYNAGRLPLLFPLGLHFFC